jgi:hypothetical protein
MCYNPPITCYMVLQPLGEAPNGSNETGRCGDDDEPPSTRGEKWVCGLVEPLETPLLGVDVLQNGHL